MPSEFYFAGILTPLSGFVEFRLAAYAEKPTRYEAQKGLILLDLLGELFCLLASVAGKSPEP